MNQQVSPEKLEPSAEIASRPVFCSLACNGKSQRLNVKGCGVCGTEIYGKALYCSKSCAGKGRKGLKYKKGATYIHKTLKLRVELAEMRGGVCERCNWSNFAALQVHHKIHQCNGGTDEYSNLELLCSNCHQEEHHGNFSFEEWKEARGK
ncbi:MAG: HNH endonuclease [Verrucomicrobiaceae bacterium]|nr:MAG: HNH endonuclease [Verrucomicrobiaceae bacterium]